MLATKSSIIYLKDYSPPPHFVDHVDLRFELGEESTEVNAQLQVRQNPLVNNSSMVLNGHNLELKSLSVNGVALSNKGYSCDENVLVIYDLPARCTIHVTTLIEPQRNTSLMGLYQSRGVFITQCEAEGFRKITFFPDRPDVMATYTTTIVADRQRYPVLLSNGNPIASGDLDHNRHWIKWDDPFPKPCYLFALVAGDLAKLENHFQTRSKRDVLLQIYVEREHLDQCHHAMESLTKAIRWDEEAFGRELDLDVYMIVAASDFNMGAMENKGLNIFNTKYVLAKPQTATDDDFDAIEAVVAHEYFHNWTGNRVTCRDWFQLSLKEGLTVFREQEFSADMTSRAARRIDDVRTLRASQFAEDGGPMAHPVRPDSYMEINNFYTATVYEKGAELIRMIHTIIGPESFRKGMDLYFERHDGQAVTTNDFVKAMEDASAVDLTQFRLWYVQAGTPLIDIQSVYDASAKTYSITATQSCAPTPGQTSKQMFHIPLALGLLDAQGNDIPLQLAHESITAETTKILHIKQRTNIFQFHNIPQAPIPSFLRNFSAPVKVNYQYSDEELTFLMAHDSDPFNRWEAGQRLALRLMLALIPLQQSAAVLNLPQSFLSALLKIVSETRQDPALLALALTLPSENYIGEQMQVNDPEAVHRVRQFMRIAIATQLRAALFARYKALAMPSAYIRDALSSGKRALRNQCLAYLMELDDPAIDVVCEKQFNDANNMTDRLAALSCFSHKQSEQRERVFTTFYETWRHDPLVINKWLTLQALSQLPNTLETVESLTRHPAFDIKNPNNVYALISAFCAHNPARFHARDGSGYAFLTERILQIDALNPQVAARLARVLERWHRLEPQRQYLMKQQLELLKKAPGISKDVYEIVSKSLV